MNDQINSDSNENDIPKDGLAQKRIILETVEEKPKPFMNLEEKDAEKLKQSQSDYRTLVTNQNRKDFSRGDINRRMDLPNLRTKPKF